MGGCLCFRGAVLKASRVHSSMYPCSIYLGLKGVPIGYMEPLGLSSYF